MKISAIICTYNREEYILDSLTSLRDQSLSRKDFEVILVDNNSTDNTALISMQFAQQKEDLQFHYYKETKQGLSHARNRGIELAQGEIIVFLDDDAVACKEYLTEIVSFFTQNPEVGSIGGRIFPKFEAIPPKWMPHHLTPLFSIIDLGDSPKPFSTGKYPVGANMAFRKEVFEVCGAFDPNLGRTAKNMMGGEEKDLFYRLKEHNFSVWYAPKPWVYHIIPQTRMTKSFIKAQAIGVGQSERQRIAGTFFTKLISFIKEFMKWGASFVLAFYYSLSAQFSKAAMLIKFRWWVTSGMFNWLKVIK